MIVGLSKSWKPVCTLVALLGFNIAIAFPQDQDPYEWLEEVEGEKAIEFSRTQSSSTLARLSTLKQYQDIYSRSLAIYNSEDRLALPTIFGEYIYNFWQDQNHVRGIWRRAKVESYITRKPDWETLLDLDEMSKQDGIPWTLSGYTSSFPDFNLFLINFSKGGSDAAFVREFDVSKKAFVIDGFTIPESKGLALYIDRNTLLVTSDMGKQTLTTSGYPKQVRIWKRGDDIKLAQIIHEGEATDANTIIDIFRNEEIIYPVIQQNIGRYAHHFFVWNQNRKIQLDIPIDCKVFDILKNQLILELRSEWLVGDKTYKQGSLLGLNFIELMKERKEITIILKPEEYMAIKQVVITKNKLVVNVLNNANGELYVYSKIGERWQAQPVPAPKLGTITIRSVNHFTDQYFFTFTNFLIPTTLYVASASQNTTQPIQTLPDSFDSSKYVVNQFKARSKDGTLIPYYVISSKATNNTGENPTLIRAYGGFESLISLPNYLNFIGPVWLENGGVYVIANIRGGGEFGAKWHQAGLKEKRQNIYDDFFAVSEDLISKKITSPKHLGITGVSNGGLLVGAAFTQRPELYGAVVCSSPLLDMKRYTKLLAGALWIDEYGDPDKPEDWQYIQRYSPYHNLKKNTDYPEVFLYTSTRDDRVHPGHARKMAARMMDMGYPIFYYENSEGGHAGVSTNEQGAKAAALQFSYLLMKLKSD